LTRLLLVHVISLAFVAMYASDGRLLIAKVSFIKTAEHTQIWPCARRALSQLALRWFGIL